jgi:hypothetical protein
MGNSEANERAPADASRGFFHSLDCNNPQVA